MWGMGLGSRAYGLVWHEKISSMAEGQGLKDNKAM